MKIAIHITRILLGLPLALAMQFPVRIQMVLLHLFLDPKTGGIAYPVLVLNVFLSAVYRRSFAGLLESKDSTSLYQGFPLGDRPCEIHDLPE